MAFNWKRFFGIWTFAAPALFPAGARGNGPGETAAAAAAEPAAGLLLLPEAVASFGACESGGWLYVYSGHTGRAHEHSRDNLSAGFRRMNLLSPNQWEELPPGPAMQSVSLAAQDGKIYRAGGLTAGNRRGEKEDLRSVAEFARYDPLLKSWQALPPLPQPRSSHDAAVIGSKLFVIGGWSIQGAEKTWHPTALSIDLAATPLEWKELPPPPFRRRALAVAASRGLLFAIGGMEEDGGLSKEVDVLDPARGEWRKARPLPGEGFGVAAAGLDDAVYASGLDGRVVRLEDCGAEWKPSGPMLFPRFFHRLVPAGGRILAVGGAGRSGHLRSIEAIPAAGGGEPARWIQCKLPIPGNARTRQAAFICGNSLYLAGGNNSMKQHDFTPSNFLDLALKIDLGSMEIKAIENFPARRQSMEASVSGGRKPDDIRGAGRREPPARAFIAGGFGHDGEVARSHAEIFSFRPEEEKWEKVPASLPEPRTQFGMAVRDGALWVFGGMDYDPRRKDDAFRLPLEVLRWEIDAAGKNFEPAGHRLPGPRRAFGSAQLGDRFYLVGGMRGNFEPVASCDVFDFRTSSWETIPPPARMRVSPDLIPLDGKLYLSGGSSPSASGDLEPNPSLEVFDPIAGAWRELESKVPIGARHMRAMAFDSRLIFFSTYFQDPSRIELAIYGPLDAAPRKAVDF